MKNVVLLLILLSAIALVCTPVPAQTEPVIKVVSAERCMSFDTRFYSGKDQDKNILFPKNREQLLLVLTLDEKATKEEFFSANMKDMYLKAGDVTFPVLMFLYSVDQNNKLTSAGLLVAVPKDARNFTLFVKGYPPTELTAGFVVHEVLKQR